MRVKAKAVFFGRVFKYWFCKTAKLITKAPYKFMLLSIIDLTLYYKSSIIAMQ